MSTRPDEVLAAERIAAERAGGDYPHVRAVESKEEGAWFASCPVCEYPTAEFKTEGEAVSLSCPRRCEPAAMRAALEQAPVAITRNGTPPTEAAQPSSWAPLDLQPVLEGRQVDLAPTMLEREDGTCLLYACKVHQVAGEPESGKGWLALHALAGVVEAGGCVAYIDFEDDELTIVGRLRALGCTDEAIAKRLLYLRPHEPLNGHARIDFAAVLERHPQLVVIDGVTEALTLLGLDLADNADIARWLELVPRRIVRTGAAVLMIDHVTKDREARGRFAIGAQHKLGIDVSYGLEVIKPFGRGRDGLVKVTIHKDRAGHVRRHAHDGGRIAELVLSSDLESGAVDVTLRPPEGADGTFRPTVLMGRIAEAIEAEPGLSVRAVRDTVKGKKESKDLALRLLIKEGFVHREQDGQAHRHYLTRPFGKDPEIPDRAPVPRPCLDRAPAQSSTTVPRAPSPVGGHGKGHEPEGPPKTKAPCPDHCTCRIPARSPRAEGPDFCQTCRRPLAAEVVA